MTAAVIIGVVALILSTSFGVLIAVIFRRALSEAFLTLNHISERATENLNKTLDRLMTIDWEKFAALRSMEDEGEEGGFTAPYEQTDEEEGGQYVRGPFGGLRLNERVELTEHEQQLLAEDFPEEASS